MPPKDAEHGIAQTTVRAKRPMPSRVVPAIPFALSKPKNSKPPPKASVNVDHPPTTAVNGEPNVRSSHEGLMPGVISLRITEGLGSDDTRNQDVVKEENASEKPLIAPSYASAEVRSSVGEGPLSLQTMAQVDRPPTPPFTDEGHVSSPTATSSPETVRKPTERFDIRQIRTDFPPAFVPAAEQQTPQSTTSSRSRPQLPARPLTHLHHPSVDSIVFGGRESSTSSPAPSLSATSAFMPPPYAAQPAHAYHTSESSAPRMYLPAYQPPPPWAVLPGSMPAASQPQFLPTLHAPYRPQPRETFTPVQTPYLNGHDLRSRDGSQSSSIAALDMQRPGPDLRSPVGREPNPDDVRLTYTEPKNPNAPLRQHTTNFFPPPHQVPIPFQYPEYAASYENVESLRVHLVNSLGIPELSDCQLHILDKYTGTQQSLFSHKVILARSPKLLQLIRENGPATMSTAHADISFTLDGKYLRIPALVDALRYIYGGPLPPFDPYRGANPSGESLNANDERIQLALQHIATATWLQVPVLAQRASEMAAALLHWSTIPALLAFALDGGLSPVWTVDDGSAERVSTCSSDDSYSKPESGGAPVHDPHSTFLLHRILTFIVHALPPNFYLDTTAPQLASTPRLPATTPTHQSRPSRSDPRLSKIRFGEISADDHQRPSLATTNTSSILLSLPFPLLRSLLEHHDLTQRLGPETVSSIMRSVIQERESRRQKALKANPAIASDDLPENHLVQNLYWVESVEQSEHHRTGCRLVRRRRDIDTPSSSGTESDRLH